MEVCFVSPAHGRYAITELVLEQRKLLIDKLGEAGLSAISLVVADDDNLDIARSFGCEVLEHRNDPLGKKCNAGLTRAIELADHIVWVGSDDWVHADAFIHLQETEIPTIRVGDKFSMVDTRAGKLLRCKSHSHYGAIPWIIPSELLIRGNGRLVRDHLNSGLDGDLIRGIRRNQGAHRKFQVVRDDPHEFRCVDLKSGENIHKFDRLRPLGISPLEDAQAALAGFYPAHLVERLKQFLPRETSCGN